MSTWMGVDGCLPTLTLWATRMQASSDTKTETAMVWHCARVYHNRFLCRTYQHSSEPLGNAATSLGYIQLAQTTSNCMHRSAQTLLVSCHSQLSQWLLQRLYTDTERIGRHCTVEANCSCDNSTEYIIFYFILYNHFWIVQVKCKNDNMLKPKKKNKTRAAQWT